MTKSRKKMNVGSTPKWRQMLNRAQALLCEAWGSLYEATRLLVEVSEDDEYRAKLAYELNIPTLGPDHIDAALDRYVGGLKRLGFGFAELRAILHHYPKRADWEHGNLAEMLVEATKPDRSAQSGAKRHVVTKKELADVRGKLEAVIRKLKREIADRDARIAELEGEIDALRQRLLEYECNVEEYVGMTS